MIANINGVFRVNLTMSKIFVAGHKGMVGSAVIRKLSNLDGCEVIVRDKTQLNLLDQKGVYEFFSENKIDEVILAAARVGGIKANSELPADFIYENLQIQTNIIDAAHRYDVNKLLFLGSSCIYPKMASQPLLETALLTGPLEKTNEAYAIAKIAGMKMAEYYRRQYNRDYRAVMPTNLYGPGDNYHPDKSHVIAGLINRIHKAKTEQKKEVLVWGTGQPRREFLHVDDLAHAIMLINDLPRSQYDKLVGPDRNFVNVGFGKDIKIIDLAMIIKSTIGFKGELKFDSSMPDGTMQKILDISILGELGWEPAIGLEEGISMAYQDFLNNFANQK